MSTDTEEAAVPMLDRIIDRAVEHFQQEDFDEMGDAFEATDAWGKALTELVQTDEDALALVNEIVKDPALRSRVRYWGEEGGDTFVAFVHDALYAYSDGVTFDELVVAKIENYDVIVADRKSRAAARA